MKKWMIAALLLGIWAGAQATQFDWYALTKNAQFGQTYGARAVVFDNSIWYHGGIKSGAQTDDLYKSNNGVTWSQWYTGINTPEARYLHGFLVFNGKMWVIGGAGYSSDLNDVWYSTNGTDWTAATRNAEFGTRNSFGYTVFDGKMWVIGGTGSLGDGIADSWYSTDGIEWTAATRNAAFGRRYQQSVTVFDNKMWLVSGRLNTDAYPKDVWYSTNGADWTAATLNAEFTGEGLYNLLTFNNKLVMMGGFPGSGELDTVWYSADGAAWTQDTQTVWPSRRMAAAVTKTAFTSGIMLLMGGISGFTNKADVYYGQDHPGTATPTYTRTTLPTMTQTYTNTPTSTRTATATATITHTFTRTSTPFPVGTATFSRTSTPTNTVTGTITPTHTVTPTPTVTSTVTVTSTPTTYPTNIVVSLFVDKGTVYLEWNLYPDTALNNNVYPNYYLIQYDTQQETVTNADNHTVSSTRFVYPLTSLNWTNEYDITITAYVWNGSTYDQYVSNTLTVTPANVPSWGCNLKFIKSTPIPTSVIPGALPVEVVGVVPTPFPTATVLPWGTPVIAIATQQTSAYTLQVAQATQQVAQVPSPQFTQIPQATVVPWGTPIYSLDTVAKAIATQAVLQVPSPQFTAVPVGTWQIAQATAVAGQGMLLNAQATMIANTNSVVNAIATLVPVIETKTNTKNVYLGDAQGNTPAVSDRALSTVDRYYRNLFNCDVQYYYYVASLNNGASYYVGVSIPASTVYELVYYTELEQGSRHTGGWRLVNSYTASGTLTPYSLNSVCTASATPVVSTLSGVGSTLETIVPEWDSYVPPRADRSVIVLSGRDKGAAYYIYLYNASGATKSGATRMWLRKL